MQKIKKVSACPKCDSNILIFNGVLAFIFARGGKVFICHNCNSDLMLKLGMFLDLINMFIAVFVMGGLTAFLLLSIWFSGFFEILGYSLLLIISASVRSSLYLLAKLVEIK